MSFTESKGIDHNLFIDLCIFPKYKKSISSFIDYVRANHDKLNEALEQKIPIIKHHDFVLELVENSNSIPQVPQNAANVQSTDELATHSQDLSKSYTSKQYLTYYPNVYYTSPTYYSTLPVTYSSSVPLTYSSTVPLTYTQPIASYTSLIQPYTYVPLTSSFIYTPYRYSRYYRWRPIVY